MAGDTSAEWPIATKPERPKLDQCTRTTLGADDVVDPSALLEAAGASFLTEPYFDMSPACDHLRPLRIRIKVELVRLRLRILTQRLAKGT
jgi:hypothetical protein